MRPVRGLLVGLALALAAAPAAAQPADAIGKPLPDPSLKDGTVVVRLIGADRSVPVSDTDVTLIVNPGGGAEAIEKRARTDADGRATFVDVPENARVRATAEGPNGPVTSTAFPMPQSGGVRVMVSTVGEVAGGGPAGPGGPMMGGGQAPKSPRERSGLMEAEPSEDGDVLLVSVSYDDPADPTPPRDHPVILVDYRWDHIASAKIEKTDAAGRVAFRGLSRGGAHSYFVMTLLPRGDGVDRLTSSALVLPGEHGMKLVLSGDKRTATTPPIDDLARVIERQAPVAVPAGEVRVRMSGAVQPGLPLELVDITTGEVVGKTQAEVSASEASQGQGSARFTGVTAGGPDKAFLVRAAAGNERYLSAPFQLTPASGASIGLTVLPRILMSFSMSAWVDDVYLGVRATITLHNSSWAPFVAGTNDKPEEVVIPLPKGFTGAAVADRFAETIGVDPTRGFVIRRPLPPGGLEFIAGFSLEHDHGRLSWDFPLPYGSVGSGMEISREGTGDKLRVEAPGARDMQIRDATSKDGRKFVVLEPIYIKPGQRMVFTLEGLPQAPGWQRWAQIIAGLLVLAILLVGLGLALWRRPARPATGKARFEQLLDELAALEADGADRARRDQLMAELEELHRKGAAG